MTYQIIRQPKDGPDGKPWFCIFSTGVDSLVVYNASYSEIVSFFVDRAAVDAHTSVTRTLDTILAGKESYFRPAALESFEKAMERIESVHGPSERQLIQDLIDGKVQA
jgi:hypothetical protein